MDIGFLIGVASSATQIEGGDLRHTWSDWHKRGKIKDNASPSRANEHFTRWKEDIDLMAEMGISIYRLGIEWARLEPEQGRYSEKGAAYYRQLLAYMKSKGIEPLLTLHHFTNPIWFENLGGFENPKNIPVFLGFVEHAVRLYSDLVDEFVTVNEPNVYAFKGYLDGEFPPGEHSYLKCLKVMSIMASCHIKSYTLIHKLRKSLGYSYTKVGFSHHMRVFEPKSRRNPLHCISSKLSEYLFQTSLSKACLLGCFRFPLKSYGGVKPGVYADFLGLNYYSRSTVSGLKDGTRKGVHTNDLGWEIYPDGIAQCAADMYALLRRPVYITENGTCDNNDSFRSRYIYEHLKVLSESGLPVERYYHWCFTDNFEWAEGETARFGLVHVNFANQKRTVKQSGRFYSEMIKQKGVDDVLYNEFIASQSYKI